MKTYQSISLKIRWQDILARIEPNDMTLYLRDDKNFTVGWDFHSQLDFKDEIDFDLKKMIEHPDTFLDNLELSKKEKFRAVELMIEDKNEAKEVVLRNVNDIVNKINKDTYRKITNRLKRLMNENDMEAFREYSEVMKLAKKNQII